MICQEPEMLTGQFVGQCFQLCNLWSMHSVYVRQSLRESKGKKWKEKAEFLVCAGIWDPETDKKWSMLLQDLKNLYLRDIQPLRWYVSHFITQLSEDRPSHQFFSDMVSECTSGIRNPPNRDPGEYELSQVRCLDIQSSYLPQSEGKILTQQTEQQWLQVSFLEDVGPEQKPGE